MTLYLSDIKGNIVGTVDADILPYAGDILRVGGSPPVVVKRVEHKYEWGKHEATCLIVEAVSPPGAPSLDGASH